VVWRGTVNATIIGIDSNFRLRSPQAWIRCNDAVGTPESFVVSLNELVRA
jgi:hypothetical protein